MNMNSYNHCLLSSQMGKKIDILSRKLILIGQKNRLQLLCILKNKPCCVCQLIKHAGLSQSLISHHLNDLKKAGLLADKKKEQWVWYSITPKGKKIIELILKFNF